MLPPETKLANANLFDLASNTKWSISNWKETKREIQRCPVEEWDAIWEVVLASCTFISPLIIVDVIVRTLNSYRR